MTDRVQLADEAERQIAMSMIRQTSSMAPAMDRVMGEIDMAYKLKLINYARRDVLVDQLQSIVAHRRRQLLEQRNARLLAGGEA